MAVVNLPEARLLRQAHIVDAREILIPDIGEVGRYQLVLLAHVLPDFVGEMQYRRDTNEPVSSITRSSVSFSPGRSTHPPISAVVTNGLGKFASGLARTLIDHFALRLDLRRAADRGDPSIAKFAR